MNEPGWSLRAFERIADLVRASTGLAFGPARAGDVERGVRRAMESAGVESAFEYLIALETGRISLDDLVAELTVHESYFFREPHHFTFVREHIFPTIERDLGPEHIYRVWSAGCASGEEAYSLAILLEQEGLARRAEVLGTDICGTILASARQARYRPWAVRGASRAFIERYFHHDGAELRLVDRIRRRVAFEQHNLALDGDPSPLDGTTLRDLIFCRNVLIYFDPATVKAVARRLFESLAPGGWLITGPSDPRLNTEAPFETVVTETGLLYRRGAVRACLHRDAGLRPTEAALRHEAASVPLLPYAEPPEGGLDDWPRVTTVASIPGDDDELWALEVRAVAEHRGNAEADRLCAGYLERHPRSTELHYLHALLLLELGRHEEAVKAARCVIYLDESSSAAYFVLGALLRRGGDLVGAARAYRNARDLSAARPADELVNLGEGARAGRLAAAATMALQSLAREAPPR
jgi:chemotaxis protein methyltransferase CheR